MAENLDEEIKEPLTPKRIGGNILNYLSKSMVALIPVMMAAAMFRTIAVVAGIVAQFATWDMAFGAFLRLKERDEKGANLGYAVSGVLGGVTEPALYGCGFKYPRTMAGMVAGGAVGGLIASVMHATLYVFGASNFLSLVGFINGGVGNIIAGIAASVAAFAVACAVTFLFGFTKEELEEDARRAAAN